MNKLILILVVICLLFTPVFLKSKASYESPHEHPPLTKEVTLSELTIHQLVDYYAEKHGVDKQLAHYVIKGESTYNPEAKGDLNIICDNPRSPYNGQPVYARGLGQLTRCYYPEISDEEAFDPQINLDTTMGVIAKGKDTCMSQFTTCRDYYQKH